MITYQIMNDPVSGMAMQCQRLSDNAFIPFCADNTDYQQFLRDVEAGAELLDAEGNVMTQEQKQTFLKTIL